MKKYFMFVAVAAAGMLASCSSDSLTAGPDPKIEPTQEERVPIQLSVSSPSVRANTRGTGTVGGVGVADDDPTNVWHGQKINVFMFTKDANKATTLKLTQLDPNDPDPVNSAKYYDDAEMITPGTGNLTPTGSTSTNIGEAMLTDGTIQYYPPTGNYDFFGYHGDDAVADDAEITKTDALWTIPFKIDGSQDLLSTKAALTEGQTTTMATLKDPKDYYSAKSARKNVQPILSFNHLLSRLSFVIIPGNDNAGGWDPTTAPAVLYADAAEYNAAKGTSLNDAAFDALDDAEKIKTPAITAHQDVDKAVYVKSIKVYSKTTGKMAVAWTGDTPENLISWTDDGAPAWLTLKDRPAYYKEADKTVTISQAEYDARPYYSKVSDASVHISPAAWSALPTDAYYYEIADPTHHITPGDYANLTEEQKALYAVGDVKGDFTEVTTAGFVAVGADVANYNLTTLTPTYPVMHHAYDAENLESTPIGEALIVAPSEEDYEMEVTLTQKVPTNWKTPAVLTEKTMTYPLTIKAPDGGFQKNVSYQVNLTVYGFERIVVTTEIKPWDTGADINVGQDE